MDDQDWRIEHLMRHLHGESFRRKTYFPRSPDWDHDHCAACFAKFMLTGDHLTQGYAVSEAYKHGEAYEWVCERCFSELAGIMEWKIIE